MSTNPFASVENTSPDSLVTSDASVVHHDCSSPSEQSSPSNLRRLLKSHHHRQSVARDPATATDAHRPVSSSSESPLKRATTISSEKPYRLQSSYDPRLSERDSIFATHYLPPDNDPGTPRLPPVKDVDNAHQTGVTPKPVENASVLVTDPPTPKAVPCRISADPPSSMEIDVRKTHPFYPTSNNSASPDTFKSSSLLSSTSSYACWADQHTTADKHSQAQALDSSYHHPLRKFASHHVGGENMPPENPSCSDRSHRSTVTSPCNSINSLSRHDSLMDDHEMASEQLLQRGSARDGDTGMRSERSVSKGRRGRVENSIEANLTNAELASHVRSRKSSHFLGLFKENTAFSERKKKEESGKRQEESLELSGRHPVHSAEPGVLHPSKSLSDLSLFVNPSANMTTEHEASRTYEPEDYQHRALPRSLLEEIRNFHLTPGGARGSSFSRSIPTQFVEGGQDYDGNDGSAQDFSSSPDALEWDSRRRAEGSEEDEEVNEQISSALYFPHERVAVSDEVDQVRDLDDNQGAVQPFEVPAEESDSHAPTPKSHELADENGANHVDISLRSKNDSTIVHGDLKDLEGPLEGYSESLASEPSGESTCESELTSTDDGGLSGREEESSLTDEAGTTPTATPIERQPYLRPRRKNRSPAVGAVELKPYRHQVGGHTTVFRFSRRAVCKQLNNRENLFYERIERRHPEMLMFLARFVTSSSKMVKPFVNVRWF